MTPSTIWEQALDENHGDYAYGPHGEMISRQDDGSYTVQKNPERSWIGVSRELIPDALRGLSIASGSKRYTLKRCEG